MPDPARAQGRLLLSGSEARMLAPLTFAISMRMLGLFLLLPVIAPYVVGLRDGSVELAGLAIGAYGLTQAFMLAPLGWLSDRVGRKPVLVAGLLVYAAGGLLAGSLEHPVVVVVGRAVQGMGAVSAVVMATVADVTRAESRAQGMALVGMAIAMSFGLSVVAAAPLAALIGVPGIFVATALMGFAAAVVIALMPLPKATTERPPLADLVDVRVLPLCLGVFAIHFTLAALFLVLPLALVEQGEGERAWLVYIVSFVVSVALAVPFIIRKPTGTRHLVVASACVAVAALAVPLAVGAGLILVTIALALFFAGFNYLEAVMPSRVSLLAMQGGHGSALGTYAIAQAAGVFSGGMVLGLLGSEYNLAGMAIGATLALAWLPLISLLNGKKDKWLQ